MPTIRRARLILRGLSVFLANCYHVLFSRDILFWGHLGLGDQICAAKAIEKLAVRKRHVYLPVKDSNLVNIRQLFGYLPNVTVVPVPAGAEAPNEKASIEAIGQELGVPIINGGREAFRLISSLFPKRGLNRNLILSAGIRVRSLESEMFRTHLMSLPQIAPPQYAYAFVHEKLHRRFGPHSEASTGLKVRKPRGNEPIWALARTISEATEVRAIGSSFMCLIIVADLGRTPRLGWNSVKLLGDDPLRKWSVEWGESAKLIGGI